MKSLHRNMVNDKGYEFIKTGNTKYHNEPSYNEINAWFTQAFGHEPRDDTYITEWYNRFESPRRVWSFSDYQRRKALKKSFPNKFGKLSIKANLNNSEYQTDKYSYW